MSAPDIAALIAAELTALGSDAKTLGARLSPGDVVRAVVLPSNGLTDLLDIGGLRVAAELPPSLLPGESITVEVMGMHGDRIDLHIVTSSDASASDPVPADASGLGRSSAPSGLRQAGLRSTAGAGAGASSRTGVQAGGSTGAPAAGSTGAPAAGSTGAPAAGRATPAGSPARSAMRIASQPAVSAAQSPRAIGSGPASPGALPDESPPDVSRAHVRAPVPPAPELKAIEARLATAHATTMPTSRPVVPGTGPSMPAPRSGAGALSRVASLAPPVAVRPLIAIRAPMPAGPVPAAPAARAPAGPGAFLDPAALLRALRLPVTATNMASARMALEAPEKLPGALATLERALMNSSDPRLTTLSALTSFIARLDPESPVLGAQIAAFVEHVVAGGEAKLAQLARAVGLPLAAASRTPAGAEPKTAAEQVAIARPALEADLKTQLMVLAADGETGATTADPAAFNAIAGALTAMTAVQLNAAVALQAHPDGLAFTLPIALPDGIAQAHVRIDRETAGDKRVALDGDNFHIAFILETRHYGTVAIDLTTVGRAVTLSVKTEAVRAQRAFSRALGDLTSRLETLRYRVAKADAVVAPPAAVAGLPHEPPARPGADPTLHVDIDA